jgi:hypothetical protein
MPMAADTAIGQIDFARPPYKNRSHNAAWQLAARQFAKAAAFIESKQ